MCERVRLENLPASITLQWGIYGDGIRRHADCGETINFAESDFEWELALLLTPSTAVALRLTTIHKYSWIAQCCWILCVCVCFLLPSGPQFRNHVIELINWCSLLTNTIREHAIPAYHQCSPAFGFFCAASAAHIGESRSNHRNQFILLWLWGTSSLTESLSAHALLVNMESHVLSI